MNTSSTDLPAPDVDQLVQVAWWYYLDGLTQDQIAKKLRVSRASVGRQLDRARSLGVVNISIAPTYYSRFQGAADLRSRYGLKEVLVLPSGDTSDTHRLAVGAAQVLQNHLHGDMTLAVGWGRAVSATIAELPPDHMRDIRVVSLTGGVNGYLDVVGNIRGERDVRDGFIPTPIVVSDITLATALRAEAGVRNVLQAAMAADIAIIGIGAVHGDVTLTSRGYATQDELASIAEQGAVGDLLGVFYDQHGAPLDLPLHQRRIGVDIEALRDIPTVIAVAGGTGKVDAVRGALTGGYVDVLVVDESLASAL